MRVWLGLVGAWTLGCGGSATLELVPERCTEAKPCLLGLGGAEAIAFTVGGETADTVEAHSADEAVARPYNLRPGALHVAAESAGRTRVELVVSGGEDTVRRMLHLEVVPIADLGLELPDGPLIADVSYGGVARPVDVSGRPLAYASLSRPPLTCTQSACRLSLPAGEHAVWRGERSPPAAVRAVAATRIHAVVEGSRMIYGLAAGDEELQVPDHPTLEVRSDAPHCRVGVEQVVGTSWVAPISIDQAEGPCRLTIAPVAEDRHPGVTPIELLLEG